MTRQALSADAEFADGWDGLGHCLLSVRSYGGAADALQRALALQPDTAGARCNLAEALFQLGRVDEAVQHYLLTAKQRPSRGEQRVARCVGLHRAR